jgi:hypothetical protein
MKEASSSSKQVLETSAIEWGEKVEKGTIARKRFVPLMPERVFLSIEEAKSRGVRVC